MKQKLRSPKESSAYRRGVVLGLTMAEIMLILLFCLLIPLVIVFQGIKELQSIPEILKDPKNRQHLLELHALHKECNIDPNLGRYEILHHMFLCYEQDADIDENQRFMENFVGEVANRNNLSNDEIIKLLSDNSLQQVVADLTGCLNDKTGNLNNEFVILLSDANDCLLELVVSETEDPPTWEEKERERNIRLMENFVEEIAKNNNLSNREVIQLLSNEPTTEVISVVVDCLERETNGKTENEFVILVSSVSDCLQEHTIPEPPTKEEIEKERNLEFFEKFVDEIAKNNNLTNEEVVQLLSDEPVTKLVSVVIDCMDHDSVGNTDDEFIVLISQVHDCLQKYVVPEPPTREEIEKEQNMEIMEKFVEEIAKDNNLTNEEVLQLLSDEPVVKLVSVVINCMEHENGGNANHEFIVLISQVHDCLKKYVVPEPPTREEIEKEQNMEVMEKFIDEIAKDNNLTNEEVVQLLSEEPVTEVISVVVDCLGNKIDGNAGNDFVILISQVGDCLQQKLPEQEKNQHDWPPIIEITDAAGYSFESGQSKLSQDFENKLQSEIFDTIIGLLNEYEANVVEVIGHTDMQPVSSNSITNLDYNLQTFLNGEIDNSRLSHSDNSGLGMARAVSVAKVLLSQLEQKNLNDIIVLPYSGAQIIAPNDTLTIGNYLQGQQLADEKRRRIEIRVRRSNSSNSFQIDEDGIQH